MTQGPHARRGVALFLVLLLAPAAGFFVPTASAQTTQVQPYLICLYGYHLAPGQQPKQCASASATDSNPTRASPTDLDDANYFEGESVPIALNVNTAQSVIFTVACVSNCAHQSFDTEGRVYQATWGGDTTRPVVFPRDFRENGQDAVIDRAGVYNSSWSVNAYLFGRQSASSATRSFGTWIFNNFLGANQTVMPGEHHEFHMAGYDDSTRLNLTLERRVGNSYQAMSLPDLSCFKTGSGQVCRGRYPVEEAANLPFCGLDLRTCYRFTATGAGKDAETVYYRIGPAHVTPVVTLYQNPVTNATPPYANVERTSNISVGVVLGYPGGDAGYRVPLSDDKLPLDPLSGDRILRVSVARADPTGDVIVETVPLHFAMFRQRFEGTWTVPRDAATNGSLVAYRFRLVEGRDVWNNAIDPLDMGNYTLTEATLDIVPTQTITRLPRTEEGAFAFRILYHNGSAFTDKTNTTALMGCFVRATQAASECSQVPTQDRTILSFEDGQWIAKVRYDRAYPNLEAHRFDLISATDTWGNKIPAVSSLPFDVVTGSPHVAFTTVFQGSGDAVIVRAEDTLFINAEIRYGDGSAFNNTAVPNPDGHSKTLTALVTKRTLGGAIVTKTPVTLTGETFGPHWFGQIPLSANNSETPLGNWTFDLDVLDNISVANVNHTSFHRSIVGAQLEFREERAPEDVEIGNKTHMRFSILRNGFDDSSAIDVGTTLNVFLYHYDVLTKTTRGGPLAKLLPTYSDLLHQYTLEFTMPPELFDGSFVFVVRGGDLDGNLLVTDAFSHPFKSYATPRLRSIVTQPAPALQRGDEATVVFDGLLGDTSVDGLGDPVIHVDHFNPDSRVWEGKVYDVRRNDTSPNHLGVFPITIDTNVGVYRFVLSGRQSDFHLVSAISANFTVLPADVTRVLFDVPPAKVTKGSSISFSFERQSGDIIYNRTVLFNGDPSGLQPPSLGVEESLFNASWTIPFEARSGKYTLVLKGEDRSGNHIVVILPPIEALPAELAGKIIGSPARAVARGTAATILFGITYPTGAFYLDPTTPRVQVLNASGIVADAVVTREGLTFSAAWTPGPQADAGADHWFEVSGGASAGNEFPTLRSSVFRITPGSISRGAASDVTDSNDRGTTISYQVPFVRDDQFVQFSVAYYGATGDVGGQIFGTRAIQSETLLPNTVDPSTSRYVTRFVTDTATPPGSYQIRMKGLDKYGNEITSESKPFLLKTSSILVAWDGTLSSSSLKEGKPFTTSFVAKYQKTGVVLDDTMGKPSAALLVTDTQGRTGPSKVKPDVSYANGHWVISWPAPDSLPQGTYIFTVGGTDFSGNQIVTSQQNAVPYDPTFSQSVSKVVPNLLPAPSPLLVLGALAALAILLRRRNA